MGPEVLQGIVASFWVIGELISDHKRTMEKIARKGVTPEYVRRMQQELSEVLVQARNKEELRKVEPKAQEVRERYMQEIGRGCKGSRDPSQVE